VFDINGGEFLILVVVALVVLGPERLPQYAAQLGRLVRDARGFAVRAREQVRNEMGEEFDEVDWKALDPRQYDPRRIVREALLEGDPDPLGLKGFKEPTARMGGSATTADLTSSEGAAGPGTKASSPEAFDGDAT
jgi:sec-independent protein translocase protein TatB